MKQNTNITVAEAAAILGVDERHVRRLAEAGTLPSEQIGKRLLVVDRAAVERYRDNRPKRGRKPKKTEESGK